MRAASRPLRLLVGRAAKRRSRSSRRRRFRLRDKEKRRLRKARSPDFSRVLARKKMRKSLLLSPPPEKANCASALQVKRERARPNPERKATLYERRSRPPSPSRIPRPPPRRNSEGFPPPRANLSLGPN